MQPLVKRLRAKMGLSAIAMSSQLGITRTGIYNYETGRRNPAPQIAHRIIDLAKMHGIIITLDDFYPKESESINH